VATIRYQRLQLILVGAIIFLHYQLEVYINLGHLWISPRALFWPTLIPLGLYCVGEMVKMKRVVDREDDPELALFFECANFLTQEPDD